MSDINAEIEHHLALANIHANKLCHHVEAIKALKAKIGDLGETAAIATEAMDGFNDIAEQVATSIKRRVMGKEARRANHYKLKWTPEKFAELKELDLTMTQAELAAHFECKSADISNAFYRLKQMTGYVRPAKAKPAKEPKQPAKLGRPKKVKEQPAETGVVINQPAKHIGDVIPTETIISKPNATRWNEHNGKAHEIKKGTTIYGPPAGHPDLPEWLERMQDKYGCVKVIQPEDEKYLIEN